MAGRDSELRLVGEPLPRGMPARCPRCKQLVDVRRYPETSPPQVWMDCWRCRLSWDMSDQALPASEQD